MVSSLAWPGKIRKFAAISFDVSHVCFAVSCWTDLSGATVTDSSLLYKQTVTKREMTVVM